MISSVVTQIQDMALLDAELKRGDITKEEHGARSNHLRGNLMDCAREIVSQGLDKDFKVEL